MDLATARKVLGVSRDADEDTVRRAYRKLVRKHHPDVGGDKATFIRIQEAYDLLDNPSAQAQQAPRQGAPRPADDPAVVERLQELKREVEEQARRARETAAEAAGQARSTARDLKPEDEDSFGALIRDALTEAGARGQHFKEQLQGRLSKLDEPVEDESELSPAERELRRLRRLINEHASRASEQGPEL
jgi:curved DNA-binding protein CbpA